MTMGHSTRVLVSSIKILRDSMREGVRPEARPAPGEAVRSLKVFLKAERCWCSARRAALFMHSALTFHNVLLHH